MSVLERLSASNTEHLVIAHYHAYQDGALTQAETAAYRQHLASCAECQAWLDKQARLAEGLKREALPPAILSPAAAARIQQDITSRMRRAMIMNNIKSFVGATAAFVILAVVVGFFLGRYRNVGTVEQVEQVATVEQTTPETEIDAGTLDEQLVEAVSAKDPAEVQRLLEAGADPNVATSSGDPVLKTAIFGVGSSMDIIEQLVEHGADVNAPDKDGNPLLPQVARRPRPEVVQLLLDAGADVNSTMNGTGKDQVDFLRAPALIHAVLGNQPEVLEILIANGADVNLAEKAYEDTALHIASFESKPDLVKILLENGADPYALSTFAGGLTPLDYAVAGVSLEAIQALIDGGVDVNGLNGLGQTALMTVIKDQENTAALTSVVTLLLDLGADPNIQDNAGSTALHHAARWGRAEAIPLLVEHGADPSLENNAGETPLDLAVDDPVIELLTELGNGG